MIEASLTLETLENDLADLLVLATKSYGNYHSARSALRSRYLKKFKYMYKHEDLHFEMYAFLRQYIKAWYDDPCGAHAKVMMKWFDCEPDSTS